MAQEHAGSATHWIVLLLCCLYGSYAVTTLVVSHAPALQDYPDWVYQGVLFAKTIAGHPVPLYGLKHYPIPNSLTIVAVGVLTAMVGWYWAAKLWVVLFFAGAGVVIMRSMALVPARMRLFFAAAASAVLLGTPLLQGALNFQFGLLLFLVVLTELLGLRRTGVLAVLLVLLFFAHFVCCAIALLAVLLMARWHRARGLLLCTLPTLALTGWYIGGRMLPSNRAQAEMASGPVSHLLPAFTLCSALLVWMVFFRERRSKAAVRYGMSLPGVMGPNALLAGAGLLGSVPLLRYKLISPGTYLGLKVLLSSGGTSATLACLPWTTVVLLTAVQHGVVLLLFATLGISIARALRSASRPENARAEKLLTPDARMRSALLPLPLVCLLFYLTGPPNALAVIGVDTRILLMGLLAGLFFLTRDARVLTRCATPLLLLLMLANAYEYACFQRAPARGTTASAEQQSLLGLSEIAPDVRSDYYRSLAEGRLDSGIFASGMFYRR